MIYLPRISVPSKKHTIKFETALKGTLMDPDTAMSRGSDKYGCLRSATSYTMVSDKTKRTACRTALRFDELNGSRATVEGGGFTHL